MMLTTLSCSPDSDSGSGNVDPGGEDEVAFDGFESFEGTLSSAIWSNVSFANAPHTVVSMTDIQPTSTTARTGTKSLEFRGSTNSFNYKSINIFVHSGTTTLSFYIKKTGDGIFQTKWNNTEFSTCSFDVTADVTNWTSCSISLDARSESHDISWIYTSKSVSGRAWIDDVYIEGDYTVSLPGEISVTYQGTEMISGTNSFGTLATDGFDLVFEIKNSAKRLNVSSIAFDDLGTDEFTLTSNPVASGSLILGYNESAYFKINFDTDTTGDTFSGNISIANDDSDENPYNFTIEASADVAPYNPTSLDATGDSVSIVLSWSDMSADSYRVYYAKDEGEPLVYMFTLGRLVQQHS